MITAWLPVAALAVFLLTVIEATARRERARAARVRANHRIQPEETP